LARALDLHSRGRRFDSDILHRVLYKYKARRKKGRTFKKRNDDHPFREKVSKQGAVTDGSTTDKVRFLK
jgi:hypothetical protein